MEKKITAILVLTLFTALCSVGAVGISLVALGNSHSGLGSYVTAAGVTNYDKVDAASGFLENGVPLSNGTGVITAPVTTTGTVQFAALRDGGGITYASGTVAANTTTSVTAANVCGSSIIQWAPTGALATATLPTAAALEATTCFNQAGNRHQISWRNTANAASSTVFSAGASTTILYASGTLNYLPGAATALLDFQVATTTANATMVEIHATVFK